jgi:hypothetical protein
VGEEVGFCGHGDRDSFLSGLGQGTRLSSNARQRLRRSLIGPMR